MWCFGGILLFAYSGNKWGILKRRNVFFLIDFCRNVGVHFCDKRALYYGNRRRVYSRVTASLAAYRAKISR